MDAVSIPKVIEYVKTETLDKGRVKTTVVWFLVNPEVMDTICMAFIRGEMSMIEARMGITIKHPGDKYSKTVALEQARKKLGKNKLSIRHLSATPQSVRLVLDDYTLEKFANGKIIIKSNS